MIARLLRRIKDNNPVTGQPRNPFSPQVWSEIVEQIEFLELDEERDRARAELFDSMDSMCSKRFPSCESNQHDFLDKEAPSSPSTLPTTSAHATGTYETRPTATRRQLEGEDYENFQELLQATKTLFSM